MVYPNILQVFQRIDVPEARTGNVIPRWRKTKCKESWQISLLICALHVYVYQPVLDSRQSCFGAFFCVGLFCFERALLH